MVADAKPLLESWQACHPEEVVVVEEEPNSGVTLLQVFPEDREEVEEVGKQGMVY